MLITEMVAAWQESAAARSVRSFGNIDSLVLLLVLLQHWCFATCAAAVTPPPLCVMHGYVQYADYADCVLIITITTVAHQVGADVLLVMQGNCHMATQPTRCTKAEQC
jgi:hypothetical protein